MLLACSHPQYEGAHTIFERGSVDDFAEAEFDDVGCAGIFEFWDQHIDAVLFHHGFDGET